MTATELVRAHGGGAGARAPAARGAGAGPGALDFDDLWRYAEAAAQSKLFPKIQTAAQAFTLMMLCQSKGLHYMQALERYDIIENRPGLKSIALAADFRDRGWTWKINQWTDRVASAWFSHPTLYPEPVLMEVKYEEFRHLHGKDVWKNYPRKMLWWRLMSATVDALEPGIKAGLPAAEEIEDFAPAPAPAPTPTPLPSPSRPAHVEPLVWGQPEGGPAVDDRQFHQIVREAEAEFVRRLASEGLDPGEFNAKTVYAHLVNAAVQQGLCEPPKDRRGLTVIAALADVYKRHRDWLRGALNDHLNASLEVARAARAEAPEPAAPDPDDYGGGEAREREPGMEG